MGEGFTDEAFRAIADLGPNILMVATIIGTAECFYSSHRFLSSVIDLIFMNHA